MKFISTAGNLKKAIIGAERIIGKNLTLPILSNILIEADKGGVKISATNLEIGLISKARAKIEKEGKFTVPARIIGNFLNQLNDDDQIEVETETNGLRVTGSGNKVLIRGMDAKDFPIMPQPQNDPILELSCLEFQQNLSKILVCASPQDNRQELTGIYLEFKKDELIFAATDSFRLAEAVIKLDKKSKKEHYEVYIEKNKSIIIPARTISEIIRNIGPDNAYLKIYTGENQIFFEIDGTSIVSRLIDGKYPEYRQILPEEYKFNATVEKDAFQRSIKLSSIFRVINTKPIRSPTSRKVFAHIIEKYKSLPFCIRQLTKQFKPAEVRLAIHELEKAGNLFHYTQLPESSGGLVSQNEHTIIVKETPIVTTA